MTESERVTWIKTVLAVSGTDPQRRAFIDGFNGYGPPPHSSLRMLEQHELGGRVHDILHPKEESHGQPS
jgi:hypothetical protein